MKKDLARIHLTPENLNDASVVDLKGTDEELFEQGYLGWRLRIEAMDGDFFQAEEYPEGVVLLENEIGARVYFEGHDLVVMRYTQTPIDA